MEKDRTNTSWEDDSRQKDAMAWSCHESGWSKCYIGKFGIQEQTWHTKDELERCGKEGPPMNGINLGRGWSISSSQTFVASTCGPMKRWCWMNKSSRHCRLVWYLHYLRLQLSLHFLRNQAWTSTQHRVTGRSLTFGRFDASSRRHSRSLPDFR